MSLTPFDRFFGSRDNGRERPAILRHLQPSILRLGQTIGHRWSGPPTRLLFPRRVRPLEMVSCPACYWNVSMWPPFSSASLTIELTRRKYSLSSVYLGWCPFHPPKNGVRIKDNIED